MPDRPYPSITFGLDVTQNHLGFDQILDRVRQAESLGFDGVWVGDHFKPNFPGRDFEVGMYLEAWSLLGALATATTAIRLGVLVSAVTHRHPAVLAAQAATIDHISRGRLELGLGAAWAKSEHEALGIPFPPVEERASRLEEAIAVIRLLFTRDEAEFDGRYYQLHGATYRPRPIQRPHPPIWIGGSGERLTMPIVARQADAWHAFGSVPILERKSALLDQLAIKAGRQPSSIVRATDLAISGQWDQIHRQIESLAEIGFTYLIVSSPAADRSLVELFARECLNA